MNKGDLVNEVAKVVGTEKEAQAAVDCVFGTITKALKKNYPVSLAGFGTFNVDSRKARKGEEPSDRRRDQNQGEEGTQIRFW